MSVILGSISAFYTFKFSITPSSNAGQQVAKNGLHWGKISLPNYDLSDQTLSAESYRILSKVASSNTKTTTIFNMNTNDSSNYAQYLGSNNGDGFYYMYIVNAQLTTTVNVTIGANINFGSWNINQGTQIIHEVATGSYYGEVIEIYSAPATSSFIPNVTILPYSTNRFSCQIGTQMSAITKVTLACFVS
jgi:hypothetical protein